MADGMTVSLYHVTFEDNARGIRQQGLVPGGNQQGMAAMSGDANFIENAQNSVILINIAVKKVALTFFNRLIKSVYNNWMFMCLGHLLAGLCHNGMVHRHQVHQSCEDELPGSCRRTDSPPD